MPRKSRDTINPSVPATPLPALYISETRIKPLNPRKSTIDTTISKTTTIGCRIRNIFRLFPALHMPVMPEWEKQYLDKIGTAWAGWKWRRRGESRGRQVHPQCSCPRSWAGTQADWPGAVRTARGQGTCGPTELLRVWSGWGRVGEGSYSWSTRFLSFCPRLVSFSFQSFEQQIIILWFIFSKAPLEKRVINCKCWIDFINGIELPIK